MGIFEASFEITDEKECPMQYKRGEWFHLSGLAFTAPKGKPSCLFLTRELTEIMLKKIGEEQFGPRRETRDSYNCSGCTGLIKFKIKSKEEQQYTTMHMRMLAATEKKAAPSQNESLATLLSSFSLFEIMDENTLTELLTHINIKQYAQGDVVIRKGDTGNFLYLMIDGKVEVLDDRGGTIASLGRGEVFGEMSLLTGSPVCATIRVVEPAKILFVANDQFRQIIIKYPSIQTNITRLIAQRLAGANVASSQQPTSAFSGQLAEIPPAELFQLLNANTKTGVVQLGLSHGKALLGFKKGEMVKVMYGKQSGEAAFFSILKEHQGSFTFTPGLSANDMKLPTMGSFMKLLMEGLQQVDEGKVA